MDRINPWHYLHLELVLCYHCSTADPRSTEESVELGNFGWVWDIESSLQKWVLSLMDKACQPVNNA